MAADKIDGFLLLAEKLEQGLGDRLLAGARQEFMLSVVFEDRGAVMGRSVLPGQPDVPVPVQNAILEVGVFRGKALEDILIALIRIRGAAKKQGQQRVFVQVGQQAFGLL